MARFWVLHQAFWGFVKWYVLVRQVPFKYWRAKLMRRCLDDGAREAASDEVEGSKAKGLSLQHLIVLTEKVARKHPLHANCLRRCMVQYEVLRRHDYVVKLHIGVRFDVHKTLQAHSWLTYRGEIINDTPEVVNTYTPIDNMEQFFSAQGMHLIQ